MNRALVSEKFPAELEKKSGRLMSVRNVLRSPMQTDSDLHEQTNQVGLYELKGLVLTHGLKGVWFQL